MARKSIEYKGFMIHPHGRRGWLVWLVCADRNVSVGHVYPRTLAEARDTIDAVHRGWLASLNTDNRAVYDEDYQTAIWYIVRYDYNGGVSYGNYNSAEKARFGIMHSKYVGRSVVSVSERTWDGLDDNGNDVWKSVDVTDSFLTSGCGGCTSDCDPSSGFCSKRALESVA
jgi:hypothetical protein